MELEDSAAQVSNMDRESNHKDDKEKLQWHLLPLSLIEKLVEVYDFGARKYAPNTWQNLKNGKDRFLSAHFRHLCAWQKGEKNDKESGLNHLQHCAWNLLAVLYYELKEEVNEQENNN